MDSFGSPPWLFNWIAVQSSCTTGVNTNTPHVLWASNPARVRDTLAAQLWQPKLAAISSDFSNKWSYLDESRGRAAGGHQRENL